MSRSPDIDQNGLGNRIILTSESGVVEEPLLMCHHLLLLMTYPVSWGVSVLVSLPVTSFDASLIKCQFHGSDQRALKMSPEAQNCCLGTGRLVTKCGLFLCSLISVYLVRFILPLSSGLLLVCRLIWILDWTTTDGHCYTFNDYNDDDILGAFSASGLV